MIVLYRVSPDPRLAFQRARVHMRRHTRLRNHDHNCDYDDHDHDQTRTLLCAHVQTSKR